MKLARPLLTAALLACLLPGLQGCFPLIAGGVAVGVLAVTDRRTVGAQTEDETLEWKISQWIGEKLGNRGHINITSYNRKVLLTGEVPNEQDKALAEKVASSAENITGVWNELQIAGSSAFGGRSTDAYITSKVKARFIDANQFAPNHVKVVTEAGVVHLLGMVNDAEARAAINVARTTDGVRKVVNLLDILPAEEIRRLDITSSQQKNTKPAPTRPVSP